MMQYNPGMMNQEYLMKLLSSRFQQPEPQQPMHPMMPGGTDPNALLARLLTARPEHRMQESPDNQRPDMMPAMQAMQSMQAQRGARRGF